MLIQFEYQTSKGVISIDLDITPISVINDDIVSFLDNLKKSFSFSKKEFIDLINNFVSIRFSTHTSHSFTLFATTNQINQQLFYPICDEPKAKTKYLCKTTELGIELFGILENLLEIEEGMEDLSKQYLLDYVELIKLR